MQLLSLGLLVGAAGPGAAGSPRLAIPEGIAPSNLTAFLCILAVTHLVHILGCWLASKAVVRANFSTLLMAVKLWFCQVAFLVTVIVGFSLLLPFALQHRQSWAVISFGCGGALFTLLMIFIIPMKIYGIGFWRSFALLLLAGGVQGTVLFLLQATTGYQFIHNESLTELRAQLKNMGTRRLEAQLAGNKDIRDEIDRLLDTTAAPTLLRRPLSEREAMVVKLQSLLQAKQRALPPGNPEAAAAFQRQLDRYLRFLQEVNAERRAQSPKAAHYLPVKNLTSLVA